MEYLIIDCFLSILENGKVFFSSFNGIFLVSVNEIFFEVLSRENPVKRLAMMVG